MAICQLCDLSEFFRLSSVLNYNLSAASLNRHNVLTFITNGQRLAPDDRDDREMKSILMESLSYLFAAYQRKRRRLGPMAVLHPLRATALFVRSVDDPAVVDILSALFHDVLEDINPQDFEFEYWRDLESQMGRLLQRLNPMQEECLVDRLASLTRLDHESYYEYIGRLLENQRHGRTVVQVKLADRLDNTLDMRIDLQDPMAGVDFFKTVFQILFVNNYPGYQPPSDHPPTSALNGARRLYQLFKNAVLLSLVRRYRLNVNQEMVSDLEGNLAEASLNEAQRTLLHVSGYHYQEVTDQRKLLVEAMEYCYGGRSNLATKPNKEYLLDGLFTSYFGIPSRKLRNQKLDLLYQNKPLMIEASVAFIVIFLSFLNDSSFYVGGISERGLDPR
jgi:hypothetical protein